MVDFHKVDPEIAQAADKLLHTQNQHMIADYLDKTGLDPAKVIKEMESQAKHLNMNLPKVAIEGIGEHMVHEAARGQNITNEYRALNDTDKVLVAGSLEQQKTGKMTMRETPDGKLASLDVETSPGVTKSVFEPETKKDHNIQTEILKRVPHLPKF